jgi:ketol-acid reductoisomerase
LSIALFSWDSTVESIAGSLDINVPGRWNNPISPHNTKSRTKEGRLMEILKDNDVTMDALDGKTVAVLGYGNQGRAQALNLRDSGAKVIIGNRDDEYRALAISEDWEVLEIPEAAAQGEILLVLTTDECMPDIWDDQIAPHIAPGNTLCWGSGYNVGYDLIKPPKDANWIMIAPIMPGEVVRTRYEEGLGVISQYAVENDVSGDAMAITLALCSGMGLARAGIYETSFRGELELNLFTEQVVWAGMAGWLQYCFELAVDCGHSPESVIMILYASTENSEIFRMMAEQGFYKQMTGHSTTSQYGSLSRGPGLINDAMKAQARHNFVNDIQGGAFVDEWTKNSATATAKLKELMQAGLNHPMSIAEDGVIAAIQKSAGK